MMQKWPCFCPPLEEILRRLSLKRGFVKLSPEFKISIDEIVAISVTLIRKKTKVQRLQEFDPFSVSKLVPAGAAYLRF